MACLYFYIVCKNRFIGNARSMKHYLPYVMRNSFHTYEGSSFFISNPNYALQNSNIASVKGHLNTPLLRLYSVDKVSDVTEEDDKTKREKQWKKMKLSLIVMGCSIGFMFISSFYVLGSPDQDEEGQVVVDEFSNLPIIKQWCSRFYFKIRYYKKVIQEPSQEKLLPDPLQYPYIQPPYTLVIELTDVLVHPDWTYQTGWRFKKRPYVDAFLEQVSAPIFEVVIFTGEQAFTMLPIINQLNKKGLIPFCLFRDSTDFIEGHHVKNLNWLNRDLSKVIVVDWDGKSVKLHPENALLIPRWKGNDDDTSLLELTNLLKMIAFNKIEDVREVLSYYRQYSDPLAKFRDNQQMLAEQLEEQDRIEQQKKAKPPLTQKFAKSFTK